MIRPHIYLEPTELYNNSVKIDILSNTQSQEFYYGVQALVNKEKKYIAGKSGDSLKTDSFFNFHTYVMEWTESEIKWYFDDNHLLTVNIPQQLTKNVDIFNITLRLVISLGVGGNDFFPGQVLLEEEANNWGCPLLILDYIKFYELSDEQDIFEITKPNLINKDGICKKFTRNNKRNDHGNAGISYNVIISVSTLLIVFAFILMNICLYVFLKNSRKEVTISVEKGPKKGIEVYDQVYDVNNIYDNTLENTYDNLKPPEQNT